MAAQLLELSPGFSCYTSSEREARHIYKEIFEEHCYDTPGLPDAPLIVDAGANIGLFTLYMKQKYPGARILAFEPAPQTFGVLQQNLALHHHGAAPAGVEAHRCGLGEAASVERFTYYPNAPGNSTLLAFAEQKEGLKELVASRFPEHGARVIDAWLGADESTEVPIRRLEHFLDATEGDVDLLKVDVEGAEFQVLGGLGEGHWARVRNVVLEISDIRNRGALERMKRLLESKGFEVQHEASHPDFAEDIFIVKARRV